MWKLILILCVTALTAGCATSPLGRQQLILIPPGQMAQMGVQAFTQLRQQEEAISNPVVTSYVACVADAITDELSGEYAKTSWEVVVFEDDAVNAFALPGGKIGVYTGLLGVAENQAQLATVIGHEVGHVIARHSAERVSQRFAASAALQLVGAYIGDPSSQSSKMAMALLGLGTQVGVLLPYSRIQESAADKIGLDLMASAGFDPRQSVALWRNMAASGGPSPPEFLSTHPAPETRIEDLQARMDRAMNLYRQARAGGERPSCG